MTGDLLEYTDLKGQTWFPFTISFSNRIDEQDFSFTIFALDFAHAEAQLGWIKVNGKLDGQIVGYVSSSGTDLSNFLGGDS